MTVVLPTRELDITEILDPSVRIASDIDTHAHNLDFPQSTGFYALAVESRAAAGALVLLHGAMSATASCHC